MHSDGVDNFIGKHFSLQWPGAKEEHLYALTTIVIYHHLSYLYLSLLDSITILLIAS